MDTTTKQRRAEQVRRRVTRLVEPLGFARTKSSFWTREVPCVVEFVHLHLFISRPAFRVHCACRVLNDIFPAPALNGPDSDTDRSYDLTFVDSDEAVSRCADAIARYVNVVGEPWFAAWRDHTALLGRGSPLDADAQRGLRQAVGGSADPVLVHRSRELLGRHRVAAS